MNYHSYLQHHGIKGQKWGVRRTPEQLGHNRKSKYEYAPLDLWSPSRERLYSIKYWKHKNSTLSKAVRAFSNLSYYPNSTERTDGPIEKLDQMKRKDVSDTDIMKDLKMVNPRPLGVAVDGTTRNCAYCTVAMEMRKRGYDVRARKSSTGLTAKQVSFLFNNATIDYPTLNLSQKKGESLADYQKRGYSKLCEYLEKQGPGASGEVGLHFFKGTGHAIYYQVDNNGSVNFYDGQMQMFNDGRSLSLSIPSDYMVIRLDKSAVNPDYIGRVVVSRSKGGTK